MRILACEAYYDGSHRAFLDGWSKRSRHQWTILPLPGHHWKWRMRHAAATFAEQIATLAEQDQDWDLLWVSDMVNLAELRGLGPARLGQIPAVVYFHENQLTYPDEHKSQRDEHFGFSNILTALAADAVWWNSAFHRDQFCQAAGELIARMPDYQHHAWIDTIRQRSAIRPPGIEPMPPRRNQRTPAPLRIVWAARWEHDKNPVTFFEACERLKKAGVSFRMSVIGQQFAQQPAMFDAAAEFFRTHIDRWGFQTSRADYAAALCEADVYVSTAHQEFFGISAVEAAAAGAFPLLPRRLAYPEVFSGAPDSDDFFYDGSVEDLTDRLKELVGRLTGEDLWLGDPDRARRAVEGYHWDHLAGQYDDALEAMAAD